MGVILTILRYLGWSLLICFYLGLTPSKWPDIIPKNPVTPPEDRIGFLFGFQSHPKRSKDSISSITFHPGIPTDPFRVILSTLGFPGHPLFEDVWWTPQPTIQHHAPQEVWLADFWIHPDVSWRPINQPPRPNIPPKKKHRFKKAACLIFRETHGFSNISPDHKGPRLFLGGVWVFRLGGGRLTGLFM